MTTDTVAEAISRAFDDVPFPEGGISSCSCSQCTEHDASFRGIPWKSITLKQLGPHPLHLSHLTVAAFRYYLPAYLLIALGETEEAIQSRFYTVFVLGAGHSNYPTIRADREARNSAFSPAQLAAIVAFLEHVSVTDTDVRQEACLARDEVWLPLLRTMTETEVERTDRVIQALVDRAADRFSASLTKFKPWHGVNGITERNLSFQLSTAFLERFPDAFAFMEVPFTAGGRKRNDFHLDAYLFSEQLAIMLECKIVWRKTHVEDIAWDIQRMSRHTLQQIQARHGGVGAKDAKQTVSMILAETWNLETVEFWCGDATKKPLWSRDQLPMEGWTYKARTVFKATDAADGTLYWLYAFGSLPAEPAAAGA